MSTDEQEKFNQWWESKGVNSVILRAQAWSAWLARAEAEQQPQPAEDPDEWVIQDRVPVRVGVDEIHWSDWDVTRWEVASGHWFPDTRYGSTQDGAVLSVRCRRRDLPKIEHDWTEDFEHENGSYQNKCSRCNVLFKGHKRRVMCKSCDLPKPEQTLSAGELKAVCDDVMRWQGKQFQKPEPQPQKTRVRLWVSQSAVIVRDANETGFGKEIHHDSEGFYVEGGQS